ncbi:Subunit of mRNA cleavage and polyadenylation fact or [Trichuris trichiura]|uniref:Subunit of mRNA cleavage and polyadenylation fact or n=1 Tax=Trichuris trichiura TaxID=36087 RepID=A0A077ZAU1_TRITR|nr:Subunit of mRNA cleavage and polyadenylation fact or [Trichuris trichiura]
MVDPANSPFSASSYSLLSPLTMNEVVKDQRLNKSKDMVLACGPSYSPLQDVTDIEEYLALNFGNSSSTITNDEKDEEERSSPVLSLRPAASNEADPENEGNMKPTSYRLLQDIVENRVPTEVEDAAKKEIETAVEFFANAFMGKESLSIQDFSALLDLFDRRVILSNQGATDLADTGYKRGRIKKEDYLRLKAALTRGSQKCQSCTLREFMLLTRQSISSYSGTF